MYWQREYVREGKAMTLTDTFKVDLPKNGLLGSLLVRLSGAQASGYGQNGGDWRIIDRITKLNILGNSTTKLKSLTGYQAQAFAFHDQGVMPPGVWRNYATNVQYEYMLINFGRWLKDPNFGIDLSLYDNVEFQLENDAAAAQFSDLTISILGYYLRDAQPTQFAGYLKTEEWKAWTTVADEIIYSNLPTENILRRIMLQAIPSVDANNVEQTNMSNLMDDIDLSLDTGEKRVFKGGVDDLMRENFLETGKPVIVGGYPYQFADKGVDLGLGYTLFGAWGAGAQDGAGAATIPTFESGRSSFTQKPETYEADSPIGVVFVGMSPFLTAMFDFDIGYDPITWLDPNARKTVKLDIHTRNQASAAGGRNAIVLDRLALPGR